MIVLPEKVEMRIKRVHINYNNRKARPGNNEGEEDNIV